MDKYLEHQKCVLNKVCEDDLLYNYPEYCQKHVAQEKILNCVLLSK